MTNSLRQWLIDSTVMSVVIIAIIIVAVSFVEGGYPSYGWRIAIAILGLITTAISFIVSPVVRREFRD